MDKEWAAERVADEKVFSTPWDPTAEQWEKEGHYAPFVAWESWMSARMEGSPNCDVASAWDEMDTLVRIELWSAMIACCEFASENKT
jgi:hypothetical protein